MAQMVTPRQALYAHLSADAAVMASVDGRLYQRRVPLTAPRPLIVIYPPISNVPYRDLDGTAYWQARLQVTVIAADSEDGNPQRQAETAAQAVIAAVNDHLGPLGGLNVIQAWVDHAGQVDHGDEIRHHIDVMIKYKE